MVGWVGKGWVEEYQGFPYLPIDILCWSLDVARLAVDATGRDGLVSSCYSSQRTIYRVGVSIHVCAKGRRTRFIRTFAR